MDQEQFISTLENELRSYINSLDFDKLDAAEIREESKRIARMSHVVDALSKKGVEKNDIEYLLLSPTPLKDISENLETNESVSIHPNELGLGYYDPHEEIQYIIENDLFEDYRKDNIAKKDTNLSEMPSREDEPSKEMFGAVKVHFLRSEPSLQALKDYRFADSGALFKIRKEIVLSPAMYRVFSEYLLGEFSFVKENRDTRLNENKEWDCLLVRSTISKEAALIAAEGYDYARYAAYLPDYTVLSLNGVPRDIRTPQSEVDDIKGIINERQRLMDVVEMQKLMCSIGEVTEKGYLPDQQYLFNQSLCCYAGFIGDRTDRTDFDTQEAIYIGDMLEQMNTDGYGSSLQIVWQDSSGQIIPSQQYIESRCLFKHSNWCDSALMAKVRGFDVLSCKDDYLRSQEIARHKSGYPQERSGPDNRSRT